MELSVRLYLALIVAVAVLRLLELARSHRNQLRLAKEGSQRSEEPGYKWMVALHTAMFAGCAAEVILADRPWIPALGWSALALFLAANGLRWWAILTLGPRWNTGVMSPSRLGVVTSEGPYRWMRHPNYTGVFLEMLALPLIHTAWVTALLGSLVHVFLLRNRVKLEESVMRRDPAWRAAFENRSRFVP